MKFYTLEEVLAELAQNDPNFEVRMEAERERLARLKDEMGEAAYFDWLCSHFVCVNDVLGAEQ